MEFLALHIFECFLQLFLLQFLEDPGDHGPGQAGAVAGPVQQFAGHGFGLIEFAARRPWILNYGSAGNGSTIRRRRAGVVPF